MSQERLKELLEQVQNELGKTESLDENTKALLGDVVEDIHVLVGPDENKDEPHGLIDRLRQATDDFEDDHPELTKSIGHLIDALSRLGI